MLAQEKLSHIVAVALLIIVVQVIVFAEYFGIPDHNGNSSQNRIACTDEAKVCPDGSAVGRVGPNCEFTECAKPSFAQIDTSTWKTYRNEEYEFEVKYPSEWTLAVKPFDYGEEFLEYISIAIPSYAGDSITIQSYTDITKKEAIYKAGFRTRAEAESEEFAGGVIPSEGSYFTRGNATDPATVAEEVEINGIQALIAYMPVRFHEGPDGLYSGTGDGKIVMMFGKNSYTTITAWRLTEEFDQILSTFKFIESQKTAKDFFSVFQDRFDNPKGQVSFEGTLPLTSEIACSIAKQACGSPSCEQIINKDTMQRYFGEIDWSVYLKPVCGPTAAFLNETKKTVLCFCAYE